jgi:hypothetical protein
VAVPPDRYDLSRYMTRRGNIGLKPTSHVRMPGGSYASVRTIGVGTPLGEVVIPTVWGNRLHSEEQARQRYDRTGKNFGTFSSIDAATRYATWLHELHAALGSRPRPPPRRRKRGP